MYATLYSISSHRRHLYNILKIVIDALAYQISRSRVILRFFYIRNYLYSIVLIGLNEKYCTYIRLDTLNKSYIINAIMINLFISLNNVLQYMV